MGYWVPCGFLSRDESSLTVAADEVEPWLAPGVGSAAGAGIGDLISRGAGLALFGRRPPVAVDEFDLRAPLEQLVAGAIELAIHFDIMANPLAGLVSARLSARRGNESELFHLPGPFSVVITGAGWRAMMLLPHMDHFVKQGRKNFLGGALGEIGRVERDLVDERVSVSGLETPAGKIATCPVLALPGDDALGRQFPNDTRLKWL